MTCPHKVATEFGVSPAPLKKSHNSLKYLFDRQLRCHVPKVMSLGMLFYFWTGLVFCVFGVLLFDIVIIFLLLLYV